MPAIADCPSFDFAHGDIVHRVYRSGDAGGPSILFMQELPGFTPASQAFVDRLRAAGYTVYVPHLFGTLGAPERMLRNVASICIRREFYLLDRRRSAPFTEWLRALCRRMQEESGGPVGAIGNCLTGAFVIPLMIDAACAAPVASQPGHFGKVWKKQWKADAGLAREDVSRAVTDAEKHDIPLLALRFRDDPMCPRERFDTLRQCFGERLTCIELASPQRGVLRRPAHSVLTIDYDPTPGSDTEQACRQVLEFFEMRLARPA